MSRADEAYAYVRGRILSLELLPGALFTEGDIAGALGVSKTPIREALVKLEHEGLVKSRPRSSYQVAPITLQDTRDVEDVRALLSGEAARRAAVRGLSESEVQEIDDVLQETASVDLDDPRNHARFEQLNRQFDELIARAAGNRRLASILGLVFDESHRVRLLAVKLRVSPMPSLEFSRAVLEAIKRRDPDGASVAMHQRADKGREYLLLTLLETTSVMSASIDVPIAVTP